MRRPLLLLVLLAAPASAGEWLSGPVRVVDGDTLRVGEAWVRLYGVDAPEGDQSCQDAGGAPWPCGAWATQGARAAWEGMEATCEVLDTDRYGRLVARCEVAGEEVNAAVVATGAAVAYRDYSLDYVDEEETARAARAGLWAGAFQAPADFRRAARAGAPAGLASEGCAIKGNVSDRGRIYHLPGTASYEATRIDPARGERWFCTPAEAEAAGWRAASAS